MSLRITVASILAFAVAGCGGGGGSGTPPRAPAPIAPGPHTGSTVDWTTFGFDVQRSGENPSETRIGSANAGTLHQLWSFQTAGSTIDTQPVVAADLLVQAANAYVDLVIAADEHGNVYGINAANGAQVWHRTLGSQQHPDCTDIPDKVYGVTGTPAIDRARSRAYLVDGAGLLHGLDLATGADVSGSPVSLGLDPSVDHVYSGPLFDKSTDRLIVTPASYCDEGVYHGRLIALSAANGTQTATFNLISPAASANGNYGAAIWGQGTASVDPRGNGRVYAATGNALPDETAQYSDGVLALDTSLGFVAFDQAKLTNTDLDFGATPAIFTPPGCPPMLAVQQKSGFLFVYGLDTIGGGPLQTLDLAADHKTGVNISAPAYSKSTNMLYVPIDNPGPMAGTGLAAFSIGGCRLSLAWNRSYGVGGPMSQAIVANGVVYAGSGVDGFLEAFDARTGAPVFSAKLGGPIFATPTVANGRLFVATWDGHVIGYGLPGDPGAAKQRTTTKVTK